MMKTGSLFSLLFFYLTLNLFSQSPDNLFQTGKKAFQDKMFLIASKNFSRLAEQFPDNPLADDAEYLKGVSEFYLKEYRKSLLTFKSFRSQYPLSPYNRRIYYWLGSACYYLGQYKDALYFFSNQIAIYPNEQYFLNHSLLLKGIILEKDRRWEEARFTYEQLINQGTAEDLHPEALFRLGGIELQLMNYQKALTAFTKILVNHADSEFVSDALFFAGECYFFLDNYPEAERRYCRVLSGYPATDYRETIFFRLCRILSWKKNYSEALSMCVQLEDDFPKGRYSEEIVRIKADLLFDLKRYSEASVEYRRAIRISPDPEEKQVVYYNLGLAYLLDGRKEEALDPLRNAVAGDPDIDEKSLYQLGITLVDLHKYEEAVKTFEQFRVRFPASAQKEDILRILGSLYEQNGEYDKSYEFFTELLTHYPDSSSRDEYLFKRGSSCLSEGDTSAALKDFFEIVQKLPVSSFMEQSQYNIGYIYSLRGEYRRALPFLQTVIEQTKNKNSELAERALLAGGVCLFNIGEYKGALVLFRQITSEEVPGPWAGESWFYQGRTFYKIDRLQDSVESFRIAAEVLKGTEKGEEAVFRQGLSEFRLNLLKKARDTFLSLAVQYPRAKRAPESFYRAGLCESLGQNYTESIDFFNQALRQIEGEDRRTMGKLIQEIHFQKGWSLYKIDRRKEAILEFETLAENYPHSVLASEAFYKMAEADFQNKQFEDALKWFTRVLSDYPKSSAALSALYWAGACASKIKDDEKALSLFLQYLETSPRGSLVDLAGEEIRRILSSSKNSSLIRDFYLKVENSPGTSETLKNQVRFEYARYIFPDNDEEALSIFETLGGAGIEEPLRSEVNFMIGEYYHRHGDLKRALDIFTGIASSNVDRIGAYSQMNIARILEKNSVLEEAAEEYLKVYFLYPEFEDLVQEGLYRAGRLFQVLGENQKAERLLLKLKEEFPESQWINRAQSR